MAALAINSPLPQFFELDGDPLNGNLYFGSVGQNPETDPVTVYWDAALTQPAAQPIQTWNGYPARTGTPAMVFTTGDYSLTVKDRRGRLILYAADSSQYNLASAVTAIRTDLANNSNSTKGAGQVGLHLTGSGEVDTSVGPYLNLQVKGLKKNYGAVMDGATSDKTAWTNAMAATGKIIEIEDGTALLDFTGATPVPQCAQIVGWGPTTSILQFGAGVTGQAIDAIAFLKMRDFKVRGSAVAGVGGIYHGKSAVWYGESHNVRVENFKGAGSYGMRVGDAQKCIIYHPYLDGNYDNLRFDRTTAAFPTSTDVVHPIIVNAQNVGLYLVDGDAMVLDAAVFDSNAKGAVVFMPRSGGTISGVELLWNRFEDNSATQSTALTDGANRYQVYAGDGTSLGGATIRFAIRSAFFAPGASAARSILLNGSACAACDIIRPDLPNTVQIACLNDAYGDWSTEWNAALDYNSVVYDPNGRDRGPYGHLTNYTPTFASSVGNYGTSYSGVPTLTRSRYKAAGRTPRLDYNVGLQLIAVTPSWLSVTLPPGWTLFSGADQEVSGRLTVNTTPTPARFVFDSAANLLKIYKADGTNFTSGAAVTFGLSAEIELA